MRIKSLILAGAVLFMVPISAQEMLLAQNRSRPRASRSANDLRNAFSLIKSGKLAEASASLFQLSLSPRYLKRRMQIRYLLGMTLYQMKLYQLAAFQFISVIRDGKSRYV